MARSGSGAVYAVTNSLSTTAVIPLKPRGGFYVSVPTGSGITTITVYGQAITGGEYTPCGTAYTGTAPYGFFSGDAFGAVNVKLVANASANVEVGLSD
jgi:hypothetical protein